MPDSYGPGDPGFEMYGAQQAPAKPESSLLTPETLSGMVSLFELGVQVHNIREQEKTKRLELELHYRARAEKVASQMEALRSAMLQQYTTDGEYQRESFAIMHRMIDVGAPDLAVEIYRILVDRARRPIMDFLIEYYDKIVLGKIRMKREAQNNT